MNSFFAILLKNLVLLILIIVSLVFIFTPYIGYKEVKFIFLGLGSLYILSACFEAYTLAQIKRDTQRFVYFTDGFMAKRIIKTIAFIASGVLLLYSESIIKYLAFLCFLIAFTEITVTLWRFFKKLCFLAFEDNVLIISTNKLHTMKAPDMAKIETRHGLTYFINKKNIAFTVRTDMMKEKAAFDQKLNEWIKQNHLNDIVIMG